MGRWAGTDLGGKTGTSNNAADGWFVAVTPKLVCGAWVGGEYRQIHFRSGRLGQGAYTALPICGKFLESVFIDPAYAKYHGRFEVPAGEDINLDLFSCEPKIPAAPKPVVDDSLYMVDDSQEMEEEKEPEDEENKENTRETEIYVPEREEEILFQN